MKLLRLKVVLAAIDGEESSLTVLRAADELARAAGAKVHVLHVIPREASAETAGQPMVEKRTQDVQRLVADAGLPPSNPALHVLAGDPAHVIRSLADSVRADAIVLGRARGAADGRALGSTALRVVTNSWAPCLVVSGTIRLPVERVLVPVDLSDTSRGALVTALSWASALRAAERTVSRAPEEPVALTALFVQRSARGGGGEGSSARAALDDALNWLRQDAGSWAGVAIDGVIVPGEDVPEAVADYAKEHDADLLVIGTRGLGLDAVGRLGSVALGVARRVASPVLLVPPAVWSEHSRQTQTR